MYSVGTDTEAKRLITLTCSLGYDGEYYSNELSQEQTIGNLEAFSEKLDKAHVLLVKSGRCTCVGLRGGKG